MLLKQSSLQRVLILPFVLLLTCLAATIGWILYRAGEDATDTLAQKALSDLIGRIEQISERHLFSAQTALRAFVPDPIASGAGDGEVGVLPLPDDMQQLEDRLWSATGLFHNVNNYVYFGREDGAFIGVNLVRRNAYELRLRKPGDALRSVYRIAGPRQPLTLIRTEQYEARQRPWYLGAVARGKTTWSPLYTDFATHEPLLTLAKPVYRVDKSLLGVAATDLSLTQLTVFFQTLSISKNGVAFIAERTGSLIATSVQELPYTADENKFVRLKAAESASPLARQAYREVVRRLQAGADLGPQSLHEFDSGAGKVQLAASVLHDGAGLDWIAVVAVPRSDFRGSVIGAIYQSLAIGLTAMVLALLLGFMTLRWVLRDIRKLTQAARSVGNGEPFRPLGIDRRDEIGQLAKSFQEMEHNLRTDRLTDVLNRDSLIAQIDFKCRSASQANPLRFALLFIDLDNFKLINDHYGHDGGDRVLIEVARRLQHAIRKDDSVARFGGDEFVIYLHGVDDDAIVDSICAKIRTVLEQPIPVRYGVAGYVGASIGAACYPLDGQDCETLFRIADTRMFALKKTRKTLENERGKLA